MIAKNTTRGLVDLVNGSEEADYMTMLNLGSAKRNGREKGGNEKKREQETSRIRKGAYEWAQHQITWEVQNPITNLSTRVLLAANSVELIVAWKLASLNQHCADTRLAYPSSLTLPNSPPAFPLGDDKIDAFFGGENGQTEDHDDPYGLLGRPPVSEAHACLVECILQAACNQFVEARLEFGFPSSYPSKANSSPSYWQQLEALQNEFCDLWTKTGNKGNTPLLFRVVQLDRIAMRWNTFSIPKLTVVEEYKERSIETLATWQRAWARIQRIRLGLQVDDQDGEGDGVIGDKESQEGGGEGDSRGAEDEEEEEEEEEKEGE